MKPYLFDHPIDSQIKLELERDRVWKNLAENKQLWNSIKQTQGQIEGTN